MCWTIRKLAELVVEDASRDFQAARFLLRGVRIRWLDTHWDAGALEFRWCSSATPLWVGVKGFQTNHGPRADDIERSLAAAGWTTVRDREIVRVSVPPDRVSVEVREAMIEATREYFADRRRFLSENVAALIDQGARDIDDAELITTDALKKLAELETERLELLTRL
jgi:hypothetical protein